MNDDCGQRAAVAAVGSTAGGIGLGGALTVLFVALKLCKVIGWSWWWVLAPVWISGGLTLTVLVVMTVLFVGVGVIDGRARLAAARQRAGGLQPNRHGPAHRWGRR